MAERSIRDFQASFVVAPLADAWAGTNGFALSQVESDGSRHYVRGSGLLTGQMMCVVRQSGPHVRIEACVHARTVARLSALWLIPEDISIEPGGFMGGLPRGICRAAVDRLLAQLGQPPITAADNAGATTAGLPAGTGYQATANRPLGILVLVTVEVINALVCLGVVQDYWWGFNSRSSYDEMNWAAFDLAMALAYLALVGGSVAVAWRLWSMRRDAWLGALQLSAGMVAVTVVSGLFWGFEAIGIVGVPVHLGIIGYLNMPPVRALFGRSPLVPSAA